MNDVYVHQLSPFLIQFTETIGIRWYGLSYLFGFFLAYLIVVWMANKKVILITAEQASDFIMYVALGAIVGGRLGYCLFYSPQLFLSWSAQFPFWGALEVHRGGMASHGGMIGIIVGSILYGRKMRVSAKHILDLTVLGGTIGVGFGRIANFINGELYGREAPADLSWAVKFPQEIYAWGVGDKSKLNLLAEAVEKLGAVTINGQSLTISKDQWLSWVSTYDIFAQRMMGEMRELLVHATQTGRSDVAQAMAQALTPRYPSQLIQSFLEGFLVFLILFFFWRKPQKPGVITGWFGVLYGVARIVGEQYRLPDAHIGFDWLGLTRGQWISVGLFLGCFTYLVLSYRAASEPLGGWGKKT
jgi:phosphatidylglycerol---prolipoprotein diacylglyceryl transferase